MELEAASEQTIKKEIAISWPFPQDASARFIYGMYITILPFLAFWGVGALKPQWQSGRFSDYLTLFLFPEASGIFLLLLVYSVVCYLFLLSAPAREAQLPLIRFGIYTGTLLALQYSILSIPVLYDSAFGPVFLLVWIFPLVVGAAHRWASRRWGTRNTDIILTLFFIGALLVGALIMKDTGAIIMFLVMALPMSAPFWSFLIALRAAFWLFKNYETGFSIPRVVGLTTWLGAYAAAWRFDILKMYELYAALPKQPPGDCYIATAAARGHPRFVHAWTIQCAEGKAMRVNAQLQVLKCAELALLAIQPRLHGSLRRIYNVVGKYLAHRIQNPFLADAAYLLLKPCEWTAELLLKIVVPEIDSISKKMYR